MPAAGAERRSLDTFAAFTSAWEHLPQYRQRNWFLEARFLASTYPQAWHSLEVYAPGRVSTTMPWVHSSLASAALRWRLPKREANRFMRRDMFGDQSQ